MRPRSPSGPAALAWVPASLASAPTVLAILSVLTAACASTEAGDGPRLVQPGAPGEPSRVLQSSPAGGAADAAYAPGDVRFMRDMIVHHAQALVMSGLAAERTDRDEILLLARRVERSQTDEIERMRRWLSRRGEPAPEPPGEYAAWMERSPDTSMPGIIGAVELTSLASADGGGFDRLFLTLMVRHHQGALTMIEGLFTDPEAGRGGEIFQLASDAGSDQRIEIARMVELLRELDPP